MVEKPTSAPIETPLPRLDCISAIAMIFIPFPDPLAIFPDEVVTQILDLCCFASQEIKISAASSPPNAPPWAKGSPPAAVLISQVSRGWRAVAIQHTHLWSHFALDFTGATTGQRSRLILHAVDYMSRSEKRDLTVNITDQSIPLLEVNPASLGPMYIIWRFARRLSKLTLSVDNVGYTKFFSSHPLPLYRLEEFTINIALNNSSDCIAHVTPNEKAFSRTRVLRRVTVSVDHTGSQAITGLDGGPQPTCLNYFMGWKLPQSLTHFYCEDAWLSSNDYSWVLSDRPNLQECQLACQHISEDEDGRPPDDPIILNDLRKLHVKYTTADDYLFRILTAPKLEDLGLTILHGTADFHLHNLGSFIARSCGMLRKLSLQYMPLDALDYAELFRALPLVEELTLRWIRPTDGPSVEDPMAQTMRDLTITASPHRLFPALRRLAVDATPASLRMLQSRVAGHRGVADACSVTSIALYREERFAKWLAPQLASLTRHPGLVLDVRAIEWGDGCWRPCGEPWVRDPALFDVDLGTVGLREAFDEAVCV
ncbi:hypothetical protein DFH09DRAFT_589329 [Mycena vulgaris]|nr:hypothetical protein DFH09DRAFT_589329 [Mycena vulgaris]